MNTRNYEIEPILETSGHWRLSATPKSCGAQPFWLDDERYDNYARALAAIAEVAMPRPAQAERIGLQQVQPVRGLQKAE